MIINKLEFIERTQIDHRTLDVWIEEEWLVPSTTAPDLIFTEADLARAELIRDLTQELGVNDEGVGVILNLLDQIHGLRKVLADVIRSAREPSTRQDQDSE